jgi:hypothetical protein
MAKLEDERSKDGEGAAVTEEWQLEPGVVSKLYDVFTVAGLRFDAIEPGHALCSFTVPPRLTVRKDYTTTWALLLPASTGIGIFARTPPHFAFFLTCTFSSSSRRLLTLSGSGNVHVASSAALKARCDLLPHHVPTAHRLW